MNDLYSEYTKLLKEFVSFKSISTDKAFKSEMEGCANWLIKLFKSSGFKTELWTEYSEHNPLVFSEYNLPNANKETKTILVYGHYDVQPANEKTWDSKKPFDLTESEGRLYARGVVDNKGQVLIHIVSILNLIKQGNLKYNVKFLIEGNEETGSPLSEVIQEKKSKLNFDYLPCNI